MSMTGTKEELAAATVVRWQQSGAKTVTAKLGRRMLKGDWTSRDDALKLGGSIALLSQVCMKLRQAGYEVEGAPVGDGAHQRLMQYRVAGKAQGPPAKSEVVKREVKGLTHPELGSVLTVRALAMTDDGELAMQLSNGTQMWSATITGHLSKKGRRK